MLETKKNNTHKTKVAASQHHQHAFAERMHTVFPRLRTLLHALYGEQPEFEQFLQRLTDSMSEAWQARPADLKALDVKRLQHPDWFQSQGMVGGVCYVDLYAGNLQGLMQKIPYFKSLGLTYLHLMPLFKAPEEHNDGGYAVSSYREVTPSLGTMQDLNVLAKALREAGISLVLDFIFNHTSNEHVWATQCLAGDATYQNFYLIYPDRTLPDLYEQTTREIFPEEHAGAFSQLADGRWVWTTFHSYQWDLNYANPEVFLAMANEMLFIANQGAEILRMDAVAFLWKKPGTDCENLPEVHTLIQAFNQVARIAAPSLMFKSEAIVHPDDVQKYIDPDKCQISYNPLQMALLWSTLASRNVNLLEQALSTRHHIHPDCSWVNYVRSHDDIGWTFSDEDAQQFYIDGFLHRRFLNDFYVNRFPGSFAEGVPFQENPKTGDCRICGTTASLAGVGRQEHYAIERVLVMYNIIMTAGGIPLIYLGDEVGILNDYSYLNDPVKASDSRWVHRVAYQAQLYQQAEIDPQSVAGKIRQGILRQIEQRKQTPALAAGRLFIMNTNNQSVLAYLREYQQQRVFVISNFSEHVQTIQINDVTLKQHTLQDLITGESINIEDQLTLNPYQYLWLTY